MRADSGVLRTNLVDIEGRRVTPCDIAWSHGIITAITALTSDDTRGPDHDGAHDHDEAHEHGHDGGFLLPGFVDAHVHLESSLLTPSEFARVAVRHGTVAAVSDPHEIANVLGIDGVRWMIEDDRRTPFPVLFGAPSCVPATPFETAGATLAAHEVEELLDLPGVGYVSEVMAYPDVLRGEPTIMAKIDAARRRGYPVDGHAPGLTGADLATYVAAGITTDHECSTLAEAEEKIAAGMRILIREGSAARNFAALHPLITTHPGRTMLCTDDLHAADLLAGHIDRLVARAVALGHDVFDVLEAACLTPREHYGLPLGRLRVGEDFTAVQVRDLRDFKTRRTWLAGHLVAEDGETLLERTASDPVNNFAAAPVTDAALRVPAPASASPGPDTVRCRVLTATDGELLTGVDLVDLTVRDGTIQPDAAADVALLAVVNRYAPAPPAVAFVRGFGLREGALASSVAHDSHNVIAAGTDAALLARAINAVVEHRGGLAVATSDGVTVLPLPIAGLMSDQPAEDVAARVAELNALVATRLGSGFRAPFMTLAFLALLVLPSLKLSDRGLFEVETFAFTEVPCPD